MPSNIMKPSTPRKPRRRNQPPGSAGPANAIPVSDYESDAPDARAVAAFASSATAVETNVQAAQNTSAPSDIDAMNLRVLQRYHPTIQSCIPGPPTSVYAWDTETDDWGTVELGMGVIFVCDQFPDTTIGQPLLRPCIFVLNRKKPRNFFIDLSTLVGLHQGDFETDRGKKLMIQIHVEDLDGPRLWGLLGDLDPMKVTYAAIQHKVNDMKVASGTAH